MINTAPDAPFGGFPDDPADPKTSGQVMKFYVTSPPRAFDATVTPVERLRLNAEPRLTRSNDANRRKMSLNEEESSQICVQVKPNGKIVVTATFDTPDPDMDDTCANLTKPNGRPLPQRSDGSQGGLAGCRAAGCGRLTPGNPVWVGLPLTWSDAITENPTLGDQEIWEFYNNTVDAHPIHLHLVRFQVINRQELSPITNRPSGPATRPCCPSGATRTR